MIAGTSWYVLAGASWWLLAAAGVLLVCCWCVAGVLLVAWKGHVAAVRLLLVRLELAALRMSGLGPGWGRDRRVERGAWSVERGGPHLLRPRLVAPA